LRRFASRDQPFTPPEPPAYGKEPLNENENRRHGRDHHKAGSHDHSPIDHARVVKIGDSDRQRFHLVGAEQHARKIKHPWWIHTGELLLKAAKSGKQAGIKLLTEQLCRALDRDGMLRQSNFAASYQRGFDGQARLDSPSRSEFGQRSVSCIG
jgi:hypothetical protein